MLSAMLSKMVSRLWCTCLWLVPSRLCVTCQFSVELPVASLAQLQAGNWYLLCAVDVTGLCYEDTVQWSTSNGCCVAENNGT